MWFFLWLPGSAEEESAILFSTCYGQFGWPFGGSIQHLLFCCLHVVCVHLFILTKHITAWREQTATGQLQSKTKCKTLVNNNSWDSITNSRSYNTEKDQSVNNKQPLVNSWSTWFLNGQSATGTTTSYNRENAQWAVTIQWRSLVRNKKAQCVNLKCKLQHHLDQWSHNIHQLEALDGQYILQQLTIYHTHTHTHTHTQTAVPVTPPLPLWLWCSPQHRSFHHFHWNMYTINSTACVGHHCTLFKPTTHNLSTVTCPHQMALGVPVMASLADHLDVPSSTLCLTAFMWPECDFLSTLKTCLCKWVKYQV